MDFLPLKAEILTGLVPRLIQQRFRSPQKLRALGEKMNFLDTPKN